jgi:ATP-dependent Clp protease ATP-binding subunit ClpC
MNDSFTPELRAVIVQARGDAHHTGTPQVHALHLLVALLRSGHLTDLLAGTDEQFAAFEEQLPALIGTLPTTDPSDGFAPSARSAINRALVYGTLNGRPTTPLHLLGALAVERDPQIVALLEIFGADPAQIVTKIAKASPAARAAGYPASDIDGGADMPAKLAGVVTDVTALAESGTLDPVIGRDIETRRVIEILCRRTKCNPVIIGEPGVGKTAIVEGLAQRIAAGDVPEILTGQRIWSIDMGGLVAGTNYRGDFEERVKLLIDTVRKRGNVIVFIDEIHTVLGTGSGSSGQGISLSDTIKPALSRGELRLIGATTTDEYRIVERDAALERRLSPVMVTEPDDTVAEAIARSSAVALSAHHKVVYALPAITQAVTLARRYLTSRRMPDAVIDVLDEAGAAKAMARRGLDADTTENLAALRTLLDAQHDAIAADDLAQAAEIAGEINAYGPLRAAVTVDVADVAQVVSMISGIDVSAVTTTEAGHLLDLEALLARRVIGQDHALHALAKAVRRRRAGVADPSRPASFIFAGPTGVGKTEAAKALAEALFGTDEALMTIDMSEYSEEHTVARLIGAPPGYVGFDEPGMLTEPVRRNPYQVLLLDELEKAHPKVFDVLLQLLEEGRVTDAAGRVVDFSHTIVIATTNAGAREATKSGVGFASGGSDTLHTTVERALRELLRPELLNRIDETVIFDRLAPEVLHAITAKFVAQVVARAADAGLHVVVTDAAITELTRAGYDPAFGARPLRRAVQAHLENALAELLLAGERSTVVVDDDGSGITVTRVPAAVPVI